MSHSEFVGVDGCKGGWFSVGLGPRSFETEVHCTFSDLLDYYEDTRLILVDIPIGLLRAKEDAIATARPVRSWAGRARRVSFQRRPAKQYNRRVERLRTTVQPSASSRKSLARE